MKRNIYSILSIFLLLLVVLSCEKEYVAPDTLSDVTWAPGNLPSNLAVRNVGESYSFRDASQGAITHQWYIQEGNFFLKTGFDPNNDSLPLFINKELGLVSTERTVHVLLNNPGINKIRMYNTFPDSVTFRGENHTFSSVKQGDVWVIDTAFEVDVYAPIEPAFKVVKDGVEIIHVKAEDEIIPVEEWDTLTIEAGTTLEYIDLTEIGRPDRRNWYLGGGLPSASGDSIAEISYYGLGLYTGGIVAGRGYPLPAANTGKSIPLIIQVIQSTRAFEKVGAITEREDEKLVLSVSGECVDFFGEEENFVVNVKNGAFNQQMDLVSVSVNAENRTQILLELKDAIYNSDTITVEYLGGNITSVDERILQPFAASLVEMNYPESLVDPDICGFEIEGGQPDRGLAEGWWSQENDPYTAFERTSEYAAVGMYSHGFIADFSEWTNGDFKTHGPNGGYGFPLEAGYYLIKVKYLYVQGDFESFNVATKPSWTKLPVYFDKTRPNEWIQETLVFDAEEDITHLLLTVDRSISTPGTNEAYIDDIQFIKLETRP